MVTWNVKDFLAALTLLSVGFWYHFSFFEENFTAFEQLLNSKIGISSLYASIFFTALLITFVLSRVLIGPLSLVEQRIIQQHVFDAFLELLMIGGITDDFAEGEFLPLLIYMFFAKYFHWMFKERVENMDRFPVPPLKFCVRMLDGGAKSIMSVLFIQQYALKFLLSYANSTNKNPIVFKSTISLTIDTFIYVVRTAIYLSFGLFFLMSGGVPLFIVIPTIRSLAQAVQNSLTLAKTYRVFSQINTKCPILDTEQIDKLNDKTCLVCREELSEARCLPCSHAFHSNCLMLWAQNGTTCPVCRLDIVKYTPTQKQPTDDGARRPDVNNNDDNNNNDDDLLAPNAHETNENIPYPPNLDKDIPVYKLCLGRPHSLTESDNSTTDTDEAFNGDASTPRNRAKSAFRANFGNTNN